MSIPGAYKVIVFQLFPFVLKSLFHISPQSINDNCYDLRELPTIDIGGFTQQLLALKDTAARVQAIGELLLQLFQDRKEHLDLSIKQAIEKIIASRGQVHIRALAAELALNSRTLERRFLGETGLSPKKFAQIIQFQSSFEQLTVRDFRKLTDIVYENGYTDQSHFIKVFKAFTGATPKSFVKKVH
jgi:AraC-like DNA-binding protein